MALKGCSRGFHARCHWLRCAPPIRCIIFSVLYQCDGLESENDVSPFYTYLQPNLPSHIKHCIIHMIWRTGRTVSDPPRYTPPSHSVRRALVPRDAATWTPVEGHPSARRPVLHPQNMAPENCAPPGPRAIFVRTVSVRSKAPRGDVSSNRSWRKWGNGGGAVFRMSAANPPI